MIRKCESAGMSRRRFLRGTAAATGLAIVPGHVLGGPGRVAPSDKVTIACVGVGSQGLRVMLGYLQQPDVRVVAVCDVNKESADYPQWGKNEFRNKVRKLLGGGPAWVDKLSTDKPIRLTRSLTVTGGVAGREPARRIVEAYYARQKRSGKHAAPAAHNDFRELLEKEKDVDAVIVGTADHWHAPISIAAMKKGKHVFCQKPMTRTVHEARLMGRVARETKVATQVAVGNQASESTRVLCEWIAAGAIGPVRRVVNWSSRPVWPQALERPKQAMPVPAGLDWDLWVGPSPARPYHKVYLPFVWRGWYDFGTGAIGDMGCYSFDTIFRALKLAGPRAVEASSTHVFAETYPQASVIHWQFPARGELPPVHLTWYDGGLKPPRPKELGDKPLPREGLLFLGETGKILCGFTGGDPRILPESKRKSFTPPPKTLPRSPGNDREWLDACKGGKTVCGANFAFEAAVTETILLGNVAQRVGGPLRWDSAKRKAVNAPAADQYVQPPCRGEWGI